MAADDNLSPHQFGGAFSPDTADYSGSAHDFSRLDRGDDFVTRNQPYDTQASAGQTHDEYTARGEGGWAGYHLSINERPVETWRDKSGQPVNSFHSVFIPNVNSIRPTN